MNPTSFILTEQNRQFISDYIKNKSITKTQAINYALELLRKYNLKKELIEGFSQKTQKDVDDAMSDFDDYLAIVDGKL